MTVGEAAGTLLQHYLDQKDLDPTIRREVLSAIPPECRFVSAETHQLAYLDMIQEVIHKVQQDWK